VHCNEWITMCVAWISWANVQYHEGYLGQMCNITRDILGKCAISRGISWANILYKLLRLLRKDDVVRLVDIYNSDKMFKSN
jgi:hypothetical protein